MIKNPMLKLILSILMTIILSITLILEIRATFLTLGNKFITDLDKISNISLNSAKSSVTVTDLTDYPEVEGVDEKGDVLKINNWQVRVKVNGVFAKMTAENGYYTYTSAKDSVTKNFTVEEKMDSVTEVYDAITKYWHGSAEDLITSSNIENSSADQFEFYQSTAMGSRVPVLHSTVTENWYMFVPAEGQENYLLITAGDPIKIVDEQATAHFDDPSVNYQDKHTYNLYEEWATTATIKELMDGDGARTKKDLSVDEYTNKNGSGVIAGSNKELDALRDAKAKIGTIKFNSAGKAEDGTKLDITSDEAKKSQWLLTSDTYYYTANGLSVYTLSAKRSKEVFSVSGTIENTTSSKRPYVIVVKYLDDKGKLLGARVIDKRESPLKAGSSTQFTVDATPTQHGIEISKIASLMFEMY